MNKEENEQLIVKRTFEDTLNAQEELRDTLESLIKEKRCLKKNERGIFLRQLAHATMGLGREIPFSINLSDDQWFTLSDEYGNVEFFARNLAMNNKDTVSIRKKHSIKGEFKTFEEPIDKFWSSLLVSLFEVFPLALDRASAMSKEYEATGGGEPYEFNPKGKKG